MKYSFYIGFKDTNKPAGKKIRAKKNGAFHKAPFFSFQ
ncbi:hypothetical protein BACCAC_02581 [Bacteroides caccae ATCC 43185]|nr:hypothetical protein BACCAC_02581 [Bacteroides caccae ATCC 43185]